MCHTNKSATIALLPHFIFAFHFHRHLLFPFNHREIAEGGLQRHNLWRLGICDRGWRGKCRPLMGATMSQAKLFAPSLQRSTTPVETKDNGPASIAVMPTRARHCPLDQSKGSSTAKLKPAGWNDEFMLKSLSQMR
jgi:hypothetical protein